MDSKKKMILEGLLELFRELEQVSGIVNGEETNNQDILVVEHMDEENGRDPILGKYAFISSLPVQGLTKEPLELMMELELPAEINPEALSSVQMATIDANFILPQGAFMVDDEGETIIYRDCITYWADTDHEKLITMIREEIARAWMVCELFADAFADLAEGRSSYMDMLDYLDQVASFKG